MRILKEISNNFEVSREYVYQDCRGASDQQEMDRKLGVRNRQAVEADGHHDEAFTSLEQHDASHHSNEGSNDTSSKGCYGKENDFPIEVYESRRENNDCYYDVDMAQKCHKLLNQQSSKSSSSRILLFPEEEWARNAPGIQWSIKPNRWWKRFCTVTEFRAGGRQVISAVGKIVQNRDGTLTILGRFKRHDYPDFRLHLSARVSKDDFEHGYLMTGALQLGDLKGEGKMEITHFAVMPKYQGKVEQ